MEVKRKLFIEFLLLVNIFLLFSNIFDVDKADANCILRLDKDFGSPSPVLLQNDEFLTPNSRGQVSLKRAAKLTLACPGTKRFLVLANDTTEFDVLEARCKTNVTFAVGRWEGSFKDIRCNGQPWLSTEPAGPCFGGINTLYRVGYKIKKKFHTLYEACFNEGLVSTTYVKHRLLPTAIYGQTGNRPNFIEGSLFGKVSAAKLYGVKHQRERFVSVLGEGMDIKYISNKQFLNRGHLAPQADFTLQYLRRATFHYVNVAPQWMRINGGDWSALEDALRRRAAALNTTLEVYTGALGVLTLEDKDGRHRQLYLTDDENNNGVVPVPMYFFKLAYDPTRKLASAFVTINSPYYNSSLTERLTFCADVCGANELPWLRWRADGAHSFCCNYPQFTDTVNFLPRLDVIGDLD